MTTAELQTLPAFVMLGPQQKDWVTAYCTNGADKIAATESAYASNDSKSALAIANRNLRHPQIKKLVTDFYGQTDETGSKDEALAIVWKQIQKGGEDLLDYLKLYGEWKGFKPEKPAPEPQKVVPEEDLTEVESLIRG